MHRTPSLHGLSHRFAVCCDDERLGRQVDTLLAGLQAPDGAPTDHWYALTVATGRGTFDVTRDGEPLALVQCPGDALGLVVWDVNRSCDGTTTLDAMVRELAAAHRADAAVIGEDVRQTVGKLAELGLLVDAEPAADGVPEA